MRFDTADVTRRSRRRLVRRTCGALVAALVLAPAALHAFHGWRHDLGRLFDGLAGLGERARELAARAEGFDQARALRALGPSELNGFVYRFDERLDEAVLDTGDGAPRPAGPLLAIEFDAGEPVTLDAAGGACSIAGGALRVQYAEGVSLETRGELAIDPRDVGEIHVRLKSESGREFRLGWASGGPPLNELAVSLFPVHGEFYTYRIRGEHLFHEMQHQGDPASRDRIRKLTLRPSDVPGDRVEIDFVRLISERAAYADPPVGAAHETVAREMRRVIYARTPSTLRFAVDVPAERVSLVTGLGVLASGDPVRFRVVVRADGRESEVLADSALDRSAWRDHRVDLSPWSGRAVEIELSATSAKGNVAFWSNPALHGAPRERMHAIVLLEDAFRADRMSCAGYWRPTTPAKDEWARSGVLFERAFAQETKTRPSCPALMTSLYPSATGVWTFTDVLDERYVTLAEVMRSQGFETAAFVQNPNAGPGAGLEQGFSYVLDDVAAGSRAEELYAAALAWIGAHRERNLFVYLHAIDPHAPYDPPPPYDAWYREIAPGAKPVTRIRYFDPERVSAATEEGRQALYAGEIAHNDACFADFRARLRELDLERDTLLAFVSDHGEFLGEHGLWDHEPPGFAPVIRVPMAMSFPGRLPAGARVGAPVQLIDIFPTVLDLARIPGDELLVQGQSLVPLMRGEDAQAWRDRVVVSDEVIERDGKDDERELGSVIFRDWHLLRSEGFESDTFLPGFATLRAFRLDRDPSERDHATSLYFDLWLKHRVQRAVGALQRANGRIWRGLTGGVGGSMEYDPRAIETLKRLGYL